MNFDDSPEEHEFRMRVRKWLAENIPSDLPADNEPQDAAASLRAAKAWQARKAGAGYASITWPKEWGGQGGTPIQQVIYDQEEARYNIPYNGHFAIGLGMCIPTMMAHATPDQLKRYVKPALYGEEIWCQLFSEPGAGSDLAGVRTRASKDGDDWVISGQKTWTSGAHEADYGILITRSDPTVPKHKGLTFFFVDMKSPGIEVRPIRQISGEAEFNDVYFNDVRIPDTHRLGEPGEGWKVALTTLMNERFTVSGSMGTPDAPEIMTLAREAQIAGQPALSHGAVRERIADWYVAQQGLVLNKFRTITQLSRGEIPGPESSIGKAVSGAQAQQVAAFALELMGPAGMTCPPAGQTDVKAFHDSWMLSIAMRIAGGTDEILRNIIAERVLGMPAEIRVDKDIPFNTIN